MTVPRFDPATLTHAAQEAFSVRRVFGEAYERDGALVIPVARVWGATGTGSGAGEVGIPADAEGEDVPAGGQLGHGGGGGFGVHVKAVGVFVVDGDGAHWRPALDVNRVILGGQLVGAVAVTVLGLALAVRRRR